ncbi:hypothetical protein Clacol_010453 [Clathrus columnatus]|uniref:F-box domain-containing protein n=1 Tax=Clathrus columnatus TaxID=1419009 RepID=A0AAV5ARL4_9AGAM|nr:hypothetical protein Clacol_010453 [Clathrus columnatus]
MPYPDGLSLHTIWDDIVYLLDSTKDLLSLALTCHTFKELIIPDHLHYRHLSIDIRMTSVWETLARRPRLAKGVRSIELSNRGTPRRLPAPVLSNIAKPVPCHVHVPCKFSEVSPEQLIDISHALTTSVPCLEGLFVNLSDLTAVMHDQHQMKRLSIWTLTSLKKVVLRSQFPSPAAIQMILSCPNIEDLDSHVTSHLNTFPFYMMQQANWTKLRRLRLQSLSLSNKEERYPDIPDIITSFFVRHSNIECLSFYVSSKIGLSTLPASSLPKLRSLSSHLDVVTSLLSKNVISRLVHLTCSMGQIDPNGILPQMDKLESLCLLGDGNGPELVHPFLSKAPNLKKISLAIRQISVSHSSLVGLRNKDAQDQYTELFLKHPIITNGDRDSVRLQIATLCEKLSTLRALKYVQVSPDYVELERDENGAYSGYHCISYKDAGGSLTWGDFFFDLSH